MTEAEAYLIEKTLIWKLGKNLTNISPGHFAEKFRPHNSFHEELPGFDFENGIYYVNVGEGKNRCWGDCRNFRFLSAGQHPKYSNQIATLKAGDMVAAYLKTRGYVGIGRVTHPAVRINEFLIDGKTLRNYPLTVTEIFENCDNGGSEYLVKTEWIKTFGDKDGKWKPGAGLFSSQLVKASLQGQQKTIAFLEQEFSVSFKDWLLME